MTDKNKLPYHVLLRRKSDGVERLVGPYDFEFSYYWWTDGNFGCDCNRTREFLRAETPDLPYEDYPCNTGAGIGISAYIAVKVIFADSSEEEIE